MPKLKPGDKAPDFALTDQSGKTVKLKDFRGKKVVVYFYPKADTPGCTTQSCSLRDAEPDLKKLKAKVLGISPDTPEKQKKFDEKYGLGFPLLADEDHKVGASVGDVGQEDAVRARASWASSAPRSSSTRRARSPTPSTRSARRPPSRR